MDQLYTNLITDVIALFKFRVLLNWWKEFIKLYYAHKQLIHVNFEVEKDNYCK